MTTLDELTELVDLIERTLAALPMDPTSPVDARTRARLEGYVEGVRESTSARGYRASGLCSDPHA